MREQIIRHCLNARNAENFSILSLAESLMSMDGVPMHGPIHHFIVPATLLTAHARRQGQDTAILQEKLGLASSRAEKVPGAFCGLWGCCGAAVGCGIFASVALDVSPKYESNWKEINQFTSRCLAHVASVPGPRCCKRVTYLALEAAVREAPEMLGLSLQDSPQLNGTSRPVCSRFHLSQECRKEGCPFYPK